MGLYLEVACKPKFWSRHLVNKSSAGPSILNVIEAVRLCAFAPPSSSLISTISTFCRGWICAVGWTLLTH